MDDSAVTPPAEDQSSQPEPPAEPVAPTVETPKPDVMIPVEETPEILPAPEHTQPISGGFSPEMPSHPHTPSMPPARPASFLGSVGTIIIFIALFITGIWLSSVLRQFMPSGLGTNQTPKPTTQHTPSPTRSSVPAKPNDPYASWKTYEVISGITKKSISGVQYKLPADILPPICDGAGCASQGTYLPGGTRFTVAPRGVGQSLKDFRGTVISDVNGTVFTTKLATVGGHQATEFSGIFSGRTISGYVFSKMRGVMIEVSDSLSLEINHFTPNGITSDFEKDEALFDSILKTVTIAGGTKGSVIVPSITPTVSPTPVATGTATIVPSKTPTATP